MPLRTRGSAALNKAQRRLALLKSIDENLDLGYGLTVAAYTELIETTRTTLEAHNTLLSRIEESRQTIAQIETSLSALSERMLSGVATKYGKNSMEYAKAGGSNRKRGKSTTPSTATPSPTVVTPLREAASTPATNGSIAQ